MQLEKTTPLVIYDNQCDLCIKFAKTVDFLSRGEITLVGHYSKTGENLRQEFLYPNATEMFWFIDKHTAYGGRAALLPLVKKIFSAKNASKQNFEQKEFCDVGCKETKAVFIRSASLLTSSKKIKIT